MEYEFVYVKVYFGESNCEAMDGRISSFENTRKAGGEEENER
jgi:hypothetical protein